MERYHGIDINDKRVLRICRKLNIKSTIKYSNNGCTRQAADPQYIAENILNREFTAKAPNEKWLTDVTEFHYYIGIEKHKVYLSCPSNGSEENGDILAMLIKVFEIFSQAFQTALYALIYPAEINSFCLGNFFDGHA